MTAKERVAVADMLSRMRRSHARLRRAGRERVEVARFMAPHDPGVAESSMRAALQYAHAAAEILKDIRHWERQAFAEMVVDSGKER